MKRRGSLAPLAGALLLALPACALVSSPPSVRHYQLAGPAQSLRLPADVSVAAGSVTGSAQFEDTGLVYQTSPYQIGFYRFHRWIEPPTEMVQDYLAQLVLPPTGARRHLASDPLMLSTKIYAFQELDEGHQTLGVVEVRFCLTSDNPALRKAVGCWSSRRSTSAERRSPEAAVEAINRSFAEVISDLVAQTRHRLGGARPAEDGD